MKNKKIMIISMLAIGLIGLVYSNNTSAAEIDDIVSINHFAINKIDQDGNPLNGAEFKIDGISYTVGDSHFPGKSRSIITTDGLYLGWWYTPTILSPTSEEPEIYYTIVQTNEDIILKNGDKINIAQAYDELKDKNGGQFPQRYQGISILDYFVRITGDYEYDAYNVFSNNTEDIIDWDKTIKDVHMTPCRADAYTCIEMAMTGKYKVRMTNIH